jgi:hypothetical protein
VPKVALSWSPRRPDPTIRAYRVYGNPDQEVPEFKGALLAEVPATQDTAVLEVQEGWWRFVVVAVKREEFESPFEGAEAVEERYVVARGNAAKPPTPDAPAGGPVDVTGEGRFSVTPTKVGVPPHKVQVIALPGTGVDPGMGHLLGEFTQEPKGPQGADAMRTAGRVWVPPGIGRTGTRVVAVRGMSAEGHPGGLVELTPPFLEDGERQEQVVLATIDKATGALVGFPAAAATDGGEYGAGYGGRLREIPAQGASGWADWGKVGGGGLFSSLRNLGRYVDNAKIRTNEWDLGASVLYRLDLYHELARDATSVWSTWPVALLRCYPMVPHEHQSLRQTDQVGTASGGWLMRETLHGGRPRQPLRDFWWEVTVGDSTPVPTGESDWKRYEPGTYLKARYGRARLCMIEPTGWWRIVTGNVIVAAQLPRVVKYGSGSPEGSVTAPRGSFYIDTSASPKALYVKGTQGGNTGWTLVGQLNIDGLTNEDVIDRHADRVPFYDASAGANRKTAPKKLAVGVVDRVTNTALVENTTTETTVYSFSVPADHLGTHGCLRLSMICDVKNLSGSPQTIRVRVKFGGSTRIDDSTPTIASSSAIRNVQFKFELRNKGSASLQIMSAVLGIGAPSAANAGQGDWGSANEMDFREMQAEHTADTTSPQTLEVTVELSAASGPPTEFNFRMKDAVLEQLNG